MKELSIEQKAKAYDEAYKKVAVRFGSNVADEIFLPESEDERIRKELLAWLKSTDGQTLPMDRYNAAIAWLEKQNSNVDNANKEYWRGYREGKQEILDKYTELEMQGEQNPAWSEEDERIYQSIMDDTVQENQLNDKQTNWLRGIKYRYFSQPKQDWSEDDERERKRVVGLLEGWLSTFKKTCYAEDCKCGINWLKSLKERYTWKPSDEQIKTCKEVYADILSAKGFDLGTVNSELNRLEEELKKLKAL